MKLAHAVLFSFLVATCALADKVYVEDPGASVPPEVAGRTLVQLVSTSASSQGHEVVSGPGDDVVRLRPSLIKLGSSYVFTVEKYQGGKLTSASKLKATQIEELDEISSRVVRAVMGGVDAAKDARVSDVTEHETTLGNRRKIARSGSTFAVGPAFLSKLNTTGPGFYFQFGKGYGMGPVYLGFRFDMAFDGEAGKNTAFFGDFNINVTYFLLDQDISPFATGEFGWGFVRDAETGGAYGGMMFGGIVGVAFLRTYSVHIQLGVRGAVVVESALGRTPALGAITLGLGF